MKKPGDIRARIMNFMQGKWSALAIMLLTFASFSLIMCAAIAPERFDLKPGDIAPQTIVATKDVEDTVGTEALREKAAAGVQASYQENSMVDAEVQRNVRAAMDGILEKKQGIDARMEPLMKEETTEAEAADTALDIAYLSQLNIDILPVVFTEGQWILVATTDAAVLQQVFNRAMQSLEYIQQNGIKEGFEEDCLRQLEQEMRRLISVMTVGDEYVALCREIIEPYFQANFLYDNEKTLAERTAAMEAVEPIIYKKWQNIVLSGDVVTAAHIAMMESLGLLEAEIDWSMYAGLVMLVGVLLLALYAYIYVMDPALAFDVSRQMLLSIVMVLALGASVLIYNLMPSLVPISISVLLITLLISSKIGIIVNVILAVLIGLLLTSTGSSNVTAYGLLLSSLVGAIAATFVLRRRQTRMQIMVAGGAMAAANALTVTAFALVSTSNAYETFWIALYSACSGPICAIICIGVQPILEAMFHLITPSKLIELSSPNQPLLKRMMLEAPGTYHHSVVVANLAEAAADEIDADSLLARVGSYYHDIGKLRRPEYFKENQIGENPHDRLDPRVSAEIILDHPGDGLTLGQQEKLPPPILDIIANHHGDTLVTYFYAKAIDKYGEENVSAEDYRYPHPRPQTKEQAIVMMADTVEAACRAMKDPSREKQRELIRKLVHQKIDDGQFDECDISLKEIDRVSDAFVQALGAIYHERMEYPELPKKPEALDEGALESAEAETPALPTEETAEGLQ